MVYKLDKMIYQMEWYINCGKRLQIDVKLKMNMDLEILSVASYQTIRTIKLLKSCIKINFLPSSGLLIKDPDSINHCSTPTEIGIKG